ncbi:GTP 3',8-cyclase MoaA [Bacillota bacterium LX-D]|nr:GTP 3',8-cyclase MoaA [Bacillota bacterium LX-D]
MLDQYGREINYLRVSLTDRCNLRCIYCMPPEGIEKKKHEDILRFEEFEKIIRASAALGVKKVRFTGGEPLVVKNVEHLIAKTAEINGIEDIGLTTNGILLYDLAKELKKAGLKRINLSLDTLNTEKYKVITRGGNLKHVIKALDYCLKLGYNPIKINTVLLKGINDKEIADFINLTKFYPVSVRFIELMPIGEASSLKESIMTCAEIKASFSALVPLKDDAGGVAKLYRTKGGIGTIGLISPLSCKFCSNCNKIRLTSIGSIKPCLHSNEEINLKNNISNNLYLIQQLKKAIFQKPKEHHLSKSNNSQSQKMMFQIGG